MVMLQCFETERYVDIVPGLFIYMHYTITRYQEPIREEHASHPALK